MKLATHSIIEDFVRTDSRPMVAAALRILGAMADDAEKRTQVVAPWAWDLRQRARSLEAHGHVAAASQAKVVARLVSAVALGEVSADELMHSASNIHVDEVELQNAVGALEFAMTQVAVA